MTTSSGARTPVPEFVAEAVEIHLSGVYNQEVTRAGPADLVEWWKDVDGTGIPMDDYAREVLAPLFLVLGYIDVIVDYPKLPEGAEVESEADSLALGLDRPIVGYILPENMLWWQCGADGRFLECLVREYEDPSKRHDFRKDGSPIDVDDEDDDEATQWRDDYVRFRLWTATESILYDSSGDKILERVKHNFGRPPIVRLIDQKKHRSKTIGKSRYEAIAELQREYYNRDSELILSDTLQAHPLLSGPEDYCKADNTLSIGPGYVLPKKKSSENGTYEGWEYTSPPKDPAASLRTNKQDLIDMKDRRACLTKPAGHAHGGGSGRGGTTVAQSGISKQLDAAAGHKLLGSIAKSLARAERFIAELFLLVKRKRPVKPEDRAEIKIVYPAKFELFSATELIDGLTKLQLSFKAAGQAPGLEGLAYESIARQLLLGLADEEYERLDNEIKGLMKRKAVAAGEPIEIAPPGITDHADTGVGPGSEEAQAEDDPSGVSAGTMVGLSTPSVQ